VRYVVIIEQGDGGFGAYVPDLPGCVTVGETREEAMRLIREAIEFYLEGVREEGLPVPEPSSSSEYVEVSAV
jgi:predicted RNase H-like HicB family nuclease